MRNRSGGWLDTLHESHELFEPQCQIAETGQASTQHQHELGWPGRHAQRALAFVLAADPAKKEAKLAASPPAYRILNREQLTRRTLRFRFLREHRRITGDVLIRKSQIATDCDFLR